MSAQVIELFPRQPAPVLEVVETKKPGKKKRKGPSEDKLVRLFLTTKQAETRTDYARIIQGFRDWAGSEYEIDLYDVRTHHVAAWKEYLDDIEDRSNATIRKRLSALGSLYRFAMNEGYHKRNPVANVKKPPTGTSTPYTGLPLMEIERLMVHVRENCGPRSTAIILTLLLTGVRVSELCNAKVENIHWTGQSAWLDVKRKGSYEDRVQLSKIAHAALHRYLDGRTEGPLILSDGGGAISRQMVWAIVRRVGEAALPDRAKKVHPHDFRHTFLSGVLRLTRDVSEGMRRGGHRDPKTTAGYLYALDAEESTLMDELETLFGVA